MDAVMFREESNIQAANLVNQQCFLKNILKKIDRSANKVISDLEEVRYHLTTPSNMMVNMATDLNILTNPMEPWQKFLPPVRTLKTSLHHFKLLVLACSQESV